MAKRKAREKATNDSLPPVKSTAPPMPNVKPVTEKKPVESVAPVKVAFLVSDGVNLNSKRGILSPGTKVFESDFNGGMDGILEHVSNGTVTKV